MEAVTKFVPINTNTAQVSTTSAIFTSEDDAESETMDEELEIMEDDKPSLLKLKVLEEVGIGFFTGTKTPLHSSLC